MEEIWVTAPEELFKHLGQSKIVSISIKGKTGTIENQPDKDSIHKMVEFYNLALTSRGTRD